ncbi:hypothetical protein [Pseudomonas brassicacearum]|uniref:hypothetical protein n=1 Tax=Pseudomonas brassicacearum TaxID=930166 RepID=UPI0006405588|nr:hypothetical protein [Pseudomonas brassicacearum]
MVDPLRLVSTIFLRTEKGMARFQDEKATEKTSTQIPLAIGFCLLQTFYYVEHIGVINPGLHALQSIQAQRLMVESQPS